MYSLTLQLLTPEEVEEIKRQLLEQERAKYDQEIDALDRENRELRASLQNVCQLTFSSVLTRQTRRALELERTRSALPTTSDRAYTARALAAENEHLRGVVSSLRAQVADPASDGEIRRLARENVEQQVYKPYQYTFIVSLL